MLSCLFGVMSVEEERLEGLFVERDDRWLRVVVEDLEGEFSSDNEGKGTGALEVVERGVEGL